PSAWFACVAQVKNIVLHITLTYCDLFSFFTSLLTSLFKAEQPNVVVAVEIKSSPVHFLFRHPNSKTRTRIVLDKAFHSFDHSANQKVAFLDNKLHIAHIGNIICSNTTAF
ncbi:hypothetical protein ACJX0J_021976, partial [Zea mays]